MTAPAALFLGFILLQRLGELALSRRNTRRLLTRGAREVGAEHYPAMVALHAAWIVSLIVFGHDAQVSPGWLGVFVFLQVLRLWILSSLGGRWTTRIIILDAPLVRRGPFRYVAHPNYMLVVAEILVAPMVLGLLWIAVIFSLLNAAMLWVRIGVEHRALAPNRGTDTRADRARGA